MRLSIIILNRNNSVACDVFDVKITDFFSEI